MKLPRRPRDEIDAFHAQSFGYALAQLSRLFHDSLVKTLDGTGLHMGHVLVLAHAAGASASCTARAR